ncbi:MAG: hypothetical protein K2O24_00855 [Muribaculaceae bacterium]|nr:hypothetical protein [Muribaculaceae bacterium]
MSYASLIDACMKDLYTDIDDLRKIYPEPVVSGVLRVREMHQWMVSSPSKPDREFIAECLRRFEISKTAAYRTLNVVKTLLPTLAQSSRVFHRWRFNEMILSTYRNAEVRGDTRTMERSAASYARYNAVDKDDEVKITPDMVVVQPFTATDDPSVLGLKRIPDLRSRIDTLLAKYSAESPDIEDISYEEADISPELPDTEKQLWQK